MVVLFAVGVMSITWMVVIAAIVFAEKVLPSGGASASRASARRGASLIRPAGINGSRCRTATACRA